MPNKVLSFLSLFTSLGTLICCAIPALLVVIGAGAALSGLISVFPSLPVISNYKSEIFIAGGILITIALISHVLTRKMACSVSEKKEMCETTKASTPLILWFSIGMYLVGILFTYLLPRWL